MPRRVDAATRFRATIERKSPDLPRYVVLPRGAVSDLVLEATSTVDGEIADVPIHRQAVKPWGNGRWFLDVKNETCQKAGVDTGDEVEIELRRVSEDPPADLIEALASNPTAAAVWDRLSRSQKRQVVNDVERAKKAETRARRISEYVDQLSRAPETHARKYGDLVP